jgi:outer membrane protein TolC
LRLALAERRLRDDTELLGLVQARREQGLATLGEQAQAEARVAQVQSTLPPIQREIETQLNRIDVLLGTTPGSTAARIATSGAPLRTPALASGLTPAELLRRRPDVVAAERELAAQDAGVRVARAEYYPHLSLGALLGMESLQTGVPKGANFQPTALLGLRWRLFDFGAVDADVARATAARREALLRYRQAMLRATEEVENALLASGWLRAEQDALARQTDAAGRAREEAHEAYVGGTASLIDELELERQQLAAQDSLVQAETDAGRALVATFRALGGGW